MPGPPLIRARSADTDPEAERVQFELLRRAGPGRRAAMAASLTQTVLELSRNAIRRALPGASEEDVRLRFVDLNYGRELAAEVRRHLAGTRRHLTGTLGR
jgi:hypothetical protein